MEAMFFRSRSNENTNRSILYLYLNLDINCLQSNSILNIVETVWDWTLIGHWDTQNRND